MAVNVSPLDFHQPGFVQRVAHLLETHAVDPARVELEITEGIVMRNVESSRRVLGELRALGLKLSVDDFGTGYSSLSYLRHFSVDKLKIDQSFVSDAEDPKIRQIISAIIAFARSLGIRTNAEGVENARQVQLLRELGCGEIQGYVAGMPQDAADFGQMLRNPPALP
jgi:EAL domain-containing protein (putative c-di-GMP-specific phosphodiesterase class I)